MISTEDLARLQENFEGKTAVHHEIRPKNELREKAAMEETVVEQSSAPIRGWCFYGSFASLTLVTFIIALDATIISVALPIISESIGATAIEAFWCGTSFLLASTVFQPTFASFSHIFGRTPILLLNLVLFTAGTIMSALARNVHVLLGGRTVQGIGGGGLLSMTYVIVTDLVSLRERGKWIGLLSLAWSVGSVVGPIIGGALAEVWWPWIFLVQLPFCAIAFVMVPITLKLKPKEGTLNKKLKEFDWVGTALFICSLTAFLAPLSWGGIMFAWNSWNTVVPLVLGAVGLILFGCHTAFSSHYSSVDPLIRPSLFSSLTGLVSYLATVVHGIIVWCALYYLPLYSLLVKDFTPLMAGVSILPYMCSVAPAAAVVGLLIARTGKVRIFVISGWAILTLGIGLNIMLDRDTPAKKYIFYYLVGGLGFGFLFSAMSFACQASSSNRDLPFAASMYAFCRSMGQCIGVAIGGVTFQNAFKQEILKSDAFSQYAEQWANDASALVQIVKRLPPGMDAMRDVVVEGFVDALRVVWIVMCALAGFAFVLVILFVKEKSLDRDFETDQGLIDPREGKNASDSETV